MSISNIDDVSGPKDDPYTMTEEILRKRAKKVDKGRFITQFYAGVLAILGSIIFGTSLGWSSPAFHQTKEKLNIYYSYSWIASLVPLGISVGVMFWSYLKANVGPRKTMLIQAIFLMLVWFLLAYQSNNHHLSMACRFFTGFLSIIYIICGESLLVETVHSGYVKVYLMFFKANVFVGVLLMHLVGQWEYFSYFVPALVFFHTVMLFFCHESPIFLYPRDPKRAVKAVEWYRGKINTYFEMKNIRRDSEIRRVDPDSNTHMLYSKVILKGIFIVIGLKILQVFSAYSAFIFFNEMIWDGYGNVVFSRYTDPIVYGTFLFLSSLCSSRVHYHIPFGAVKPLTISTCLITLNLSFITTYCFLWDYKDISNFWWFPIILVSMNFVSYEIGLSVIPGALLFEYMPYQVYPLAKTIVNCLQWVFVFIFVKVFSGLENTSWPFPYTFALCTAVSFFGIIYVRVFVVEVKNKTLVQIQLDIGGNPIGNRGLFRRQKENKSFSVESAPTV